ncbi:ribonuclease HII [Thermotoga sp. KOL6]|uniref:ribonuclease HII n=1 Tax=Thermotoga sp. KOL6 TaxID=126741 RepID=UPI000C77F68C|nr:ribonuclease HII [Thermotoga sp. KOL6]PLV58404.1 ribonuclease HII [Thermotoga sp. KOL6]
MRIDDFYKKEYGLVVGVDEAGRGCLAGPVVAAAVFLKENVEGINDSKQLSPKIREELFGMIMKKAVVGIGIATPEEIDILNIFNATKIAMNRALENLSVKPAFVLVDGKGIELNIPGVCLVKGDQKSKLIGAASIVAKVIRDRMMEKFSKIYPQFSFHEHKGYATKKHLDELKHHGVLPIHRMSFKPVLENLSGEILSEFLKKNLISKERFEKISNLLGARRNVVFRKEGVGHNLTLF